MLFPKQTSTSSTGTTTNSSPPLDLPPPPPPPSPPPPSPTDSSIIPSPSSLDPKWYSAVAAIFVGLGIAGTVLLFRRFRRKQITRDLEVFIRYLELPPPPQPSPPAAPHPLTSLKFAVADVFDVEGFVTGFGSPDWERTHEPASRTASAVMTLVQAGAMCIGKTHMDEMAYNIYGQNKHYGTLVNPTASYRVPGGPSSGSAVAVASKLSDFALGIDTHGGVRVPAAYCGILGFRPSHGAVSCDGMVRVAQSLDTVGWLARDPEILCKVGHILLRKPSSEAILPKRVVIAEDCFNLNDTSQSRDLWVVLSATEKLFGKQAVTRMKLGEFFASKIPSLKMSLVCFRVDGEKGKAERGAAALKSLMDAFLLLHGHEFKLNHEEWIQNNVESSASGISEHIIAALKTNSELVSDCMKLKHEARSAMNELLMNDGVLVLPTIPGPPPLSQARDMKQTDYEDHAFTLLSIASMSGCCQVSMPIGEHDSCTSSISFIARNGADTMLLYATPVIHPVLQKEVKAYPNRKEEVVKEPSRPEDAESAKEKGNLAFKKKDFKAAVESYSEAIRRDENNATYYSNRAAAYLALYNYHQAETDCSKAIELDKKNIKAFLRRATAREYLGHYEDANEDFRQALVYEPTNKTAIDGAKRLKKLLSG